MVDQRPVQIVGLGASAGGLLALKAFLSHVPENSGLAYIVVQHLAPTGKAMLSELIQRSTRMKVDEARQGEVIERDSVYVIPQNTEIRVEEGCLQLTPPSEPRGLRLPINVLFSSLASARGEDAIAVVLSGMGSDGTLGLQAVKAVGGLTLVQSPETAQFDSMPQSAIDAGCVDIQDSADALPERILDYVRRIGAQEASQDGPETADSDSDALSAITKLLQKQTRHDFSLYKASTLQRRIERRQIVHSLASMAEYAEFLADNPQEADLLFHELLIGVTSFFRDPEVWNYLSETALPALLDSDQAGPGLRVWCIGCSTGEEAYSLAIALDEAIQNQSRPFKVQIFATDLNPEAISVARRREYPLTIKSSVSEQRLERYFSEQPQSYRISQSIRDQILFAQHDVILDPPFTKLDLICCRNLLIYFDPQLQQRLLPLFHYSLRPDGLLLLGSAEGIGRSSHLFAPIESRRRLFRRKNPASGTRPEFLLRSYPPLSANPQESEVTKEGPSDPSDNGLQAAADRLLLQVYAPAAVVLNRDADIVYISGRTGRYLEPAAGKANWNIHAMARDGLRQPLARAIEQASNASVPIRLNAVQIRSDGELYRVDVTVQAISEPDSLRGLIMVVFNDVSNTASDVGIKPGQAGAQSNAPQRHRNEIQALSEEARSYREKAKAAQEELQATNEELQSTNEELTTSKEEMQSMNEELQTINSELQSKLDDLLLAQSDVQNVLNSVEIAILYLDKDLNIRRFTERAADIIRLRESDIGRPLSDLTNSLQYPDLQRDAIETLRKLQSTERQIQSTNGRWFKLRIMPYRRLDDVIDGVVITLLDITEAKTLELSLQK